MADELWIKPSEPADVPQIVALRNDPSTLFHLHDVNQYNTAQTETWLRTLPATSKRYSVFEWLNTPATPAQCGDFGGGSRA